MESAKCIIEVTAGIIPQRPEDEYTRQYAITSREWEQARASDENGGEMRLLAERNGVAQGYAGMLMLQPNAVNWVRTDWIWL